jgi:hypothetical protein
VPSVAVGKSAPAAGPDRDRSPIAGAGPDRAIGKGTTRPILTGIYHAAAGLGMVVFSLRPGVTAMEAEERPPGARGPISGREFDPAAAGGPVRRLTTARITITDRGIDVIERHVARFGPDPANQAMIRRLRDIVEGRLPATLADLNFYARELREFVRYRRQGFSTGAGDDYDLWNNAHTAALEDYGLNELDADGNRNLFHPDAWPLLPR